MNSKNFQKEELFDQKPKTGGIKSYLEEGRTTNIPNTPKPISYTTNQNQPKRSKPTNSNEMLAYLSNREYKPNDVDDFSNFQTKKEYSPSDYKEKFNHFFPEGKKKENIDSFFVKSKII